MMGGGSNSTGAKTSHSSRKPSSANTEQKLDDIKSNSSRRQEYDVFISHSWDHGDHYDKIQNLLEKRGYFNHKNYSVPKDDPLDPDNPEQLWEDMRNRVKNSSVLIVPAGMYVAHSNWIRAEINMAKNTGTPVVAVKPRGSQKIPKKVQEDADKIVGWNKDSIVEAVQEVTD